MVFRFMYNKNGGKTAAFSGNCLLLMIACDAGGSAAMFFMCRGGECLGVNKVAQFA